MQKLVLLLSCLVCLTAAGRLGLERKPWWWQNVVGHEQEPTKWEISEENIHQRQKFLLDVLLQVQNPVVHKELIDMGKVLINDPAAYREPQDELLWEFLELCREHEVLGRTEIYTETKIDHVRQLVGLTKFLTLAKDWPTFQRNVCFARLHMNPIMFVNALLMAVHEREDTRCLVMPAMHEILPQLFYDKDVILTAENVEWLDLVSKTTTTKPSLLNVIGLGNMLSMMSPIHWIRMGKTGLWRPWHERHWSPIEAKRMEGPTEVEMKQPMDEKMIVGQMGGPIIAPIGVTWHTQPDSPVAEDKIDDTKILRQSEEKLIIPVEEQNSLSYLTDDVGLNIFWNHAMNQRLVEIVTGDKHHKLHHLDVEKTMPWEKKWKNHGRWERVEGRDETKNWERAGGMDEDRRHTEWHPVMTKAEKQQWWNEKLMAGERDEMMKHEWTKADWMQDDDIPEKENVEDMIRRERMHGRNTDETENKSSLHANRRRQSWERPSWWHKRQNVPEMSDRTEKRWNSHGSEVRDEEDQKHIRNRWMNIRNGRGVVEDSMSSTTDRMDRQHVADWMAGEQKPNRGNWLKPESNNDWSLWQQRNHRLTEEMTNPQGRNRGHSVETVEDNVYNNMADEIMRREHVGLRDHDDERLNKHNGWVADIENMKWKSRDQPWRRDEVDGKNWWQHEQRKVNDDDWRMPRTNEDDEENMKWKSRDQPWRRDEVEGKNWWQHEQRKVNDDDWRMPRTNEDDEWMKTQRTERLPSMRRTSVDEKDEVEDGDKDWQKTWQDRHIIDVDRLMYRTMKDDDWVNSQRRPIVGDREDVEIHTMWEDRRPIVDDRKDVKVHRRREDRRAMDDDRWMSRTTNDDDWVTPKHERNDDDKEIRHSRITRSIKTVDISPAQELMNARSGEMFIQNMQQLMARINMEKISLAQTMETKPVDEHIWRKLQLMTTSGKLYQQMMVSPSEAHIKIEKNIRKLKQIIDSELEHEQMHPNNPEVVKMIGEILIEANGEMGNVWDELYNDINMAIYGLDSSDDQATVLSVPSCNLREPIYQDILTSLNELIWRYKQQLQPYKREQLLVPGIHVDHVEVDDLVTYFDVTDGDLINLVDQQLLQSTVNNVQKLEKQLVARQQRLNHKQFTLGYDITAEQPQRVVVRTFLGPKVDEHGRPMPLEEARQHYMLLDAFVENLIPGGNHIERNSRDIVWTTRDTSSLSEIYRRVMQAMPMHELVSSNCRYPHRLLLPRGTTSGLPMQLLIVVTPVSEEDRVLQELVNPEWLCGLGIAAMHLDTLPLDFPLDRTIENVVDFLQPNMLMKDVLIKHDERVEVPRV